MRNKKFVKAACTVATIAVAGASSVAVLHAAQAATISYNMDYLTVKLNGRTIPSGFSVNVGDTVTVQAAGKIGTNASEQTYAIYANGTNIYTAGMESATYTVTASDSNLEFTVDSALTREAGMPGGGGTSEDPSTPSAKGKYVSFNADDLSITNNGNPLIDGSMVPIGSTLTYEAGWRTSENVKSVTIAGNTYQGATGTYTVTEDSPATITFSVEFGSSGSENPEENSKYVSFNSDDISITNNGNPLIDGSKVPVGSTLTYEAGWRSSDQVKSVTIAGTVYSGATGTYTVTDNSPSPITFSVEYKNSTDTPPEQTYQLSFDASTLSVSVDGASASSGQTVTKASQITVSPIQKTGYRIKDVKIVGMPTGKTDTFTFAITDGMTSPITIEVEYEVEQGGNTDPVSSSTASLIFDSSAITVTNGSTTMSSGSTLSGGEALSITVADKSGYNLSDVRINGNSYGTSKSMTLNIPSDLSGMSQIKIEAIYTEKGGSSGETPTDPTKPSAVIIFDSSCITITGSNGALSSGSSVNGGDVLSITIADKDGYDFTDAKVNGVSYGESKSMTLNVPSDLSGMTSINIEAVYKEKSSASAPTETPTDTPAETNNATNSQALYITFPNDVSVTRYGDVLKSGDVIKEGDVLRITAFKENNTLADIKVNGTSISNASLYTVDGTGHVSVTTSYNPITANEQENTQSGTTTPSATTNTNNNTVQQNNSSAVTTYPVTINVSDSATRRSVSGVRVSFYNSNRALLSTYTTDGYGNVSTNLAAGTYYYRIVSAPDGYVIPEYDHYVNVLTGGGVSGDVNITLDSGAVTITRKDPVSGVGVGGSTIAVKDSSGRTVATATTDSSGKITVKGLAPGTYTYTETSAAPGHTLDTSTYSFTVRGDGSASGTLVSNAEVSSVNIYVKDSASDKAISGVTVTIYDAYNNAVKTATTDSSGHIVLDNLSSGSYSFKVTGGIPSGYEDLSETARFTLSNGTLSGNTVVHLKAKSSNELFADDELVDNETTSSRSTVIPVNSGSSSSVSPTNTGNTSVTVTAPSNSSAPVTTSIKTAGTSVKTGVENNGSRSAIRFTIASMIGSAAAALGIKHAKKDKRNK